MDCKKCSDTGIIQEALSVVLEKQETPDENNKVDDCYCECEKGKRLKEMHGYLGKKALGRGDAFPQK